HHEANEFPVVGARFSAGFEFGTGKERVKSFAKRVCVGVEVINDPGRWPGKTSALESRGGPAGSANILGITRARDVRRYLGQQDVSRLCRSRCRADSGRRARAG